MIKNGYILIITQQQKSFGNTIYIDFSNLPRPVLSEVVASRN